MTDQVNFNRRTVERRSLSLSFTPHLSAANASSPINRTLSSAHQAPMSGLYGYTGDAGEGVYLDYSELEGGQSLEGLLDEDSNLFNDETFGDSLGDPAPLGKRVSSN